MSSKPLSKKDQTAIAGLVVVVIGAAIGFGMFMANAQDKEIRDTPLTQQRLKHPTHLKVKGPAPQTGSPFRPPPADVEYVEYESSAGKLGAWLMRPYNMEYTKGKRPTVLWGHGGYAIGLDDAKQVLPLVSSGYIVMIPAWRGENGNPGNFEMCFGEVDDAAAALKYLQSRPDVDADNIFAGGHSIGATDMLLLAETTPGLKKVVVCGAYPNMRETGAYEGAPFNPHDIYETEVRAPAEHVKFLTCPVVLIYGAADELYVSQAKEMKKAATKAGKKVELEVIPDRDHFTSMGTAVTMMLEKFRE